MVRPAVSWMVSLRVVSAAGGMIGKTIGSPAVKDRLITRGTVWRNHPMRT